MYHVRLRSDSTHAGTELVTSAVLLEHFGAKLDPREIKKFVLPELKKVQELSILDTAAHLDLNAEGFNDVSQHQNARAFILLVELKRNGAGSLQWVATSW